MDLSIIIVNYRGWKRLRECLDSLRQMSGNKFSFEVIVVDNASGDGLLEEFENEFSTFRFIKSPKNGGFAYGCNLGAGNAKGHYLLFLNPDTVVTEDSISKLLERSEKKEGLFISSCRQLNSRGKESRVCGIFPRFGTFTGTGRLIYRIFFSRKYAELTEPRNNIIYPDWVSGSVMMTEGESFRTTGGFDTDYWMYYEDTDICRRVKDMGGEICCFSDITLQHNHGGSSRLNMRTTALTKTEALISLHVYVSKHFRGPTGYLIQIFLVISNLFTGVLSSVTGIIFFFHPKILVRVIIFGRLLTYYISALSDATWISRRSVNHAINN